MLIYITITIIVRPQATLRRAAATGGAPPGPLGAKDRTPEINTSEIIVDCRW